jgi:hypothetical protein
VSAFGNTNVTDNEKQFFINLYAYQAIAEMEYAGIPASITLAQAILESGWGRGTVATNANNYFCIKCNHNWQGETFNAKDDDPGLSCFRKYDNVAQSFTDHSDFLRNGKRYEPLFSLEKTDFRGWCKGLKKYGYATDPNYANKLIDLIENYGLWVFDLAVPMAAKPTITAPQKPKPPVNNDIEVAQVEEVVQMEQIDNTPSAPVRNNEKEETAEMLTLPFYSYKKNESAAVRFQSKPTQQPVPVKKRRIKIRPILPSSNVRFDRIK